MNGGKYIISLVLYVLYMDPVGIIKRNLKNKKMWKKKKSLNAKNGTVFFGI